MALSASLSMHQDASAQEQRFYELIPLLPLPEIDLSISMRSHFIRNRHIHQLMRILARSPLTLLGYIASLVLAVVVFFVRSRLGRILSIVVQVIGLPGILVSLGNLRYEMVVVMFKTYDVWFAGVTGTIACLMSGLLVRDARALFMFSSWISFLINICVDASILGLRDIWIANTISVLAYILINAALTMGITEDMKIVSLIRINGHELPAFAVVRDGMITVVVVIARNAIRKYRYAVKERTIESKTTLFRCVSFRCRLQLRAVIEQSCRVKSLTLYPQPIEESVVHTVPTSSKTKLRFAPDIELIDVEQTLVPMRWLWRRRGPTLQQLLPSIGLVSFVITNTMYLLNIAWSGVDQLPIQLPIIILTTTASTVFIGVTTATMQRQLLYTVVTSFDFVFIAAEITAMHIALADIFYWRQATTIALISDLQWCLWILCWDAITPSVRRRLGLSRRLAARIGTSLVVVLVIVAVIVFVVKSPNTINNRVLVHFDLFTYTIETRVLPWYFSSVVTILSWVIRLMWRLWSASESELVVLDGTVVYENQARSVDKSSKQHTAPIPIREVASNGLAVVPVG